VIKETRTLTALVENKAGVLNRIASLFRRRRFNIESLTVGHSEKPNLSRMTIVVEKNTNINQVFRQMYKIVEVIKIKKLDESKAIVRDLALIRVKNYPQLAAIVRKFEGKIANKNDKSTTIEISGTPEKINNFLETVRKSKILEVARSGVTAVAG